MTTAPQGEAAESANAIQRHAGIGDKLITKASTKSGCSGFGLVGEPGIPVHLSPGTELAFDKDIHYYHRFSAQRFCIEHKTARFRHLPSNVNADNDALELADGRLIMLTELAAGQTATVMKVPPLPPPRSA
jgi:hypothetical protein